VMPVEGQRASRFVRPAEDDCVRRRAGVRVVLAPDKFKGSLTSEQVAEHLARGLVAAWSDIDVVSVPVADGGDGTLHAAVAAGFRRREVTVTGPTGQPVRSAIAVRNGIAVVELAAASGLALLADGQPQPLEATSWGTGELIRAALDADCTEIILGVGGSASTDGGSGMLQALGARLLDSSGEQLGPGGGALRSLDRVDLSDLDPRLKSARFVLASDVDNPLLGDHGGARIYGPQKGATSRDIEELESGMERWASLVDYAAVSLPGAGAAGGVGYAALTVLGAIRRPGVEVVLELTGFQEAARGAVLVITGEGSLDAQTLSGKAPVGVARAAGRLGVPAIAVCGQCHVDPSTLASVGLGRAYALTDIEPCIEICISRPGPLLEDLAGRIARDLAGGRISGDKR